MTRVDELVEPDDLSARFSDWRTSGIGGGGGTDFRPPFEKLEELGIVPDLAVYFTDMHGRFPDHEPAYPVVWAATTDKQPPFGAYVHVEI